MSDYKTMTNGNREKLTRSEKLDVAGIWHYALELAEFTPEGMEGESIGSAPWANAVHNLLHASLGHNASYYRRCNHIPLEEAERLIDAAYEAGIGSMLDAYFEGVPLEDILA